MNDRKKHMQKTSKTRRGIWIAEQFAPRARRYAKRMVAKAARRESFQ